MADPAAQEERDEQIVADILETLVTGGYDGTEGADGSSDTTFTDFGIVCGTAERLCADLAGLRAQVATLEAALQKLANSTHKPQSVEGALLQIEVERIARAALAGEAGDP